MLWAYQRVMFGPLENSENKALRDLSLREIMVFLPIVLMFFVMGVYPKPFLSRMEPTVEALLKSKFEQPVALKEINQPRMMQIANSVLSQMNRLGTKPINTNGRK
jgi:NADH-quinone oxidoreductase subunit M